MELQMAWFLSGVTTVLVYHGLYALPACDGFGYPGGPHSGQGASGAVPARSYPHFTHWPARLRLRTKPCRPHRTHVATTGVTTPGQSGSKYMVDCASLYRFGSQTGHRGQPGLRPFDQPGR